VNSAKATHAQEFSKLMCLADGTGPLVADVSAKAQQLADFHSVEHIKPFLDFFFDKRFSSANPQSKFTRARMSFGGPLRGYKNRDDGDTEQTAQTVDWFMSTSEQSAFEPENFDAARHGPLRHTLVAGSGGLRQQMAEKTEDSTDVELTYLFTPILFDEIIGKHSHIASRPHDPPNSTAWREQRYSSYISSAAVSPADRRRATLRDQFLSRRLLHVVSDRESLDLNVRHD